MKILLPLSAIAIAATMFADVQLSAQKTLAPQPTQLALLNCKTSVVSDLFVVQGEVQNISGSGLGNIAAVLSMYSKDGAFISSEQLLIDSWSSLMPNGVSKFKVSLRRVPEMSRYTLGFQFLQGAPLAFLDRSENLDNSKPVWNIQRFVAADQLQDLVEPASHNTVRQERQEQEGSSQQSTSETVVVLSCTTEYAVSPWMHVYGQVKNISSTDLKDVEVVVGFNTPDGTLVWSDSGPLKNSHLLPDEVSDFKLLTEANFVYGKIDVTVGFRHSRGGQISLNHGENVCVHARTGSSGTDANAIKVYLFYRLNRGGFEDDVQRSRRFAATSLAASLLRDTDIQLLGDADRAAADLTVEVFGVSEELGQDNPALMDVVVQAALNAGAHGEYSTNVSGRASMGKPYYLLGGPENAAASDAALSIRNWVTSNHAMLLQWRTTPNRTLGECSLCVAADIPVDVGAAKRLKKEYDDERTKNYPAATPAYALCGQGEHEVRKKSSYSDSPVVAKLSCGESVVSLGEVKDGCLKVQTKNGKGYIPVGYLLKFKQ